MPARGSYLKGVAKRDQILQTALDVVARRGLSGTSIREIAEAVDLSQAGVLHYFESKDELFIEILRKRDEIDVSPEGEASLQALRRVVAHNKDVPGLVQLFDAMSTASTDPSHAGHAFMIERYDTLRGWLADDLREQQRLGVVRRDVDPEMFASVLLAVVDGLQTQWLLDPEQDMSEHLDAVIALALEPGAALPPIVPTVRLGTTPAA